MIYDIPDSGYSVFNASIISAHLIRNPQWADVFDPETIDGRYYLLINADGTLAIYNSILEENIKAWTLAQTIGSFVDVACVANEAKVLVKRQINTGGVVAGNPQGVYTVDSTFNVFRNITAAVAAGTGSTVMVQDGDYVMIGNEIPFTRVVFSITTPASQDLNFTYEFLTNTGAWEAFTPDVDSTNGFTASGTMVWDYEDLSNWKSQILTEADTVNGDGVVYYWIRIKRNNANTVTSPVIQFIFINTQFRIYIERLSFDKVMDCNIETTSDAAGLVIGLDAVAGQNVFVFVNGFPIQTYYVQSDGTLDLGLSMANANITIGLDSPPLIIPMPIVNVLQTGYSVYEPKKIKSFYIDYFETLGLTVQGQNLPQVVPGVFMTDEVPTPDTGYYEAPAYTGWDPRVEIVISQSYPANMTIRGISYEVEIT
jgi:hypothetical protein